MAPEKTARVLLVEDDEDDFILTKDYLQQLESHQFIVDWVTNPVDALAELKRGEHDICLLDYQLGSYNGLTVLEEATESGCPTPIIMLTGQSDEALDQSALKAGAVDYLVKGEISTSRFARAIRYALARNEIEHERVERIKAETRNRSKDRFLAHLSHELRTPLTSILGYTELLLTSEKARPVHNELNTILNNGRHLLGLLNNVLDLSKIAVGKFELNLSVIHLPSFIADVASLMHLKAEDKGISLEVSALTPLPDRITGDPIRLRQILINLLHNAIKFTQQGSVELSIGCHVEQGQELLQFAVKDTGVGIPADKLRTIFKPFEQVEDIVTRQEEGAGLGLAICAELVKRMGGKIKVDSAADQGSCFTFTLDPGDISQQPRHFLSLEQSHYQNNDSRLGSLSGRVLVVDDIDEIRVLIGHFCTSFGLEVEFAIDGEQAIKKIQQAVDAEQDYNVILMDIHMPNLDGRRAIAKIRAMGHDNPILAITAANMKGVKEELQSLGFNDIVGKPIDKLALYSSLSIFLSTTQSKERSSERGKELVLLLEDDKDAAQVTRLLLESLGIDVEVADTGSKCIQLCSSDNLYSTILIDRHLPDADGLELTAAIKKYQADARLVLLSGEQLNSEQLANHQLNAALLKPVNLDMLKSLFQRG